MRINTGALYIIFIMLAICGFAYLATGPAPSQTSSPTGTEVAIQQTTRNKAKANLQLYNFAGATITPPITNLCKKGGANKNPDALIAYSPTQGNAVSSDGQISLWVSDNKPPYVSPGEQAFYSSGLITTAGDQKAKARDGYLLEPQLYIFPDTVENNGKHYFPNFIKGAFNNGAPQTSLNTDVLPINSLPEKKYTVEFQWDVAAIGLTDGGYKIEFVTHDGNQNLGVTCISIRVYTPAQSESQQNELPL